MEQDRRNFCVAEKILFANPDVETDYNSKHDKAGVDFCVCHMLKVKDAKSGKTFTSHWRTNPKNYLTDTCLTCHPSSTEQQAKYGIESMCAHYQGKRSATPSSGSVEFIDRALALNANHPKALELAGSAEVEAGNLKAASRYWEALHDGLPSGSEVRRELVLAFERLRGAATQSIPSTPRVSAPAF